LDNFLRHLPGCELSTKISGTRASGDGGINRFFDKAMNDRQTLLTTVHALLEAPRREAMSTV
jgi:hypothetical protein